MKDIMKTGQYFEEYGLLIRRASETVENEILKNLFFSMFLPSLASS